MNIKYLPLNKVKTQCLESNKNWPEIGNFKYWQEYGATGITFIAGKNNFYGAKHMFAMWSSTCASRYLSKWFENLGP